MIGGQIVVAGGERIDTVPPQLITTVEVFAPGADAWAAGPAPPINVHGATGAVVNGQFIVTAGSDVAGNTSHNRATQILEFPPR